jgi:hypothetical protein
MMAISESMESNKFYEQLHKKIVVSCLSPLILKRLYDANVITPCAVIAIVKRQFNIELSPGTVYAVFLKLEQEGNIKRLKYRKKIYVLTDLGKQNIEYFDSNLVFFRLLSLY